jgi:polysaccharide biosynthesis protein PslH
MKILQLCKKFPFPVKDGESIAVTYLAKALDQLGCDVTLLAMNTSKHRVNLADLSHGFEHYADIHAIDIDNHLRPLDALRNLLFSKKSYHIERFVEPAFEAKLRQLLARQRFDVIQLETLYLAPYLPIIRQYSDARIVLRSHNVEHEIWERIATNSHPLKKWYLQKITPRLRQFEIEHLNQYDLVVGITARDLLCFKKLGLKKPAIVTPIGLECAAYQPDFSVFEMSRPLSLSFIGSLDWMPNLEGLRWFLDEVWSPLLRPRFPDLELHIAGRNAPAWLLRLDVPGIIVHGEVADAAQFLNQHPITIAPLLSGGGMRAKILEGMALGRVVVSTTLGMEGIDVQHRREALLADTPQAWQSAIEWCHSQRAAMQHMGRAARDFCAENFDNQEVAQKMLERYAQLVRSETALT